MSHNLPSTTAVPSTLHTLTDRYDPRFHRGTTPAADDYLPQWASWMNRQLPQIAERRRRTAAQVAAVTRRLPAAEPVVGSGSGAPLRASLMAVAQLATVPTVAVPVAPTPVAVPVAAAAPVAADLAVPRLADIELRWVVRSRPDMGSFDTREQARTGVRATVADMRAKGVAR